MTIRHIRSLRLAALILVAGALATGVEAAPIIFAANGQSPASIQATVDNFRTALGPNNGNAVGPLAGGRREINWDGGGATNTTSNGTPLTTFKNIRGANFTTPGTGFVQSPLTDPNPADVTLGDVFGNATYATTFATFSPFRVFTPVGSNITDVTFFIPAVNAVTPAAVNAFGAVVSDVDTFGTTTLEFFDVNNAPFATGFLSPVLGQTAPLNGTLSFLGVIFDPGVLVTRVRITLGTAPLGGNDSPTNDVVVLDDLIYSEPVPVPEPATLTLVGVGLLVARRLRRR
jgi:hypothetical protein